MTDHTPQTPQERAAIDIAAAIVSLEDIEQTLTGDLLAEALDIRARLERLKGLVQDA